MTDKATSASAVDINDFSSQHQGMLRQLFDYVERRNETEQSFKASIAAMYEHNARWSNAIVRLGVGLISIILKPRTLSIKYYFWGNKFEEVILGLPKNEVCVIGGPKQLLFCLRHRRKFLPQMRLWRHLATRLAGKDTSDAPFIGHEISKISHQLNRNAKQNAALIVDNDSMPMQRAIILAAREAGSLRTICIQDGIFQSKSPGHVMHGWFSDKFLVINQHQREMLINKGMDANKIKVMGFHSSPYNPMRPIGPPGQRKVCFLGQPWAKYGEKKTTRYLEIISTLAGTLHATGVEMFYKPHPWERGSGHLSAIRNVIDVSLHDAFEDFDVFISLTSTALLEAVSAGRVAVQIMDDHFDADDLSAHGRIIVIDANKVDQWQAEILTALITPPSPPAHTHSPAVRLVESLAPCP